VWKIESTRRIAAIARVTHDIGIAEELAGLLGPITVVFVVHTRLGHFRSDLLLYAVAVLFVLIHGAPTHAQWRAALSRPAV
jgi:hypothetical protein